MNNSRTLLSLVVTLLLGASVSPPTARAADILFTNLLGGEFLNPFNWSPNSVPGAADNADFALPAPIVTWSASRTNANAFFNIVNGGLVQVIGTNFWLVTNSYVVGQTAGKTSAVVHVSGELRVTNAAGTAQMLIGQNGGRTYLLNGGSVAADKLFSTNNGPGFTNSALLLGFGNLTTLHGSIITQAVDFAIGTVSNGTATWNILGGTNTLLVGGTSRTRLGDALGARGIVNVVGPSTIWTNSRSLEVGNTGASCALVVSNGAKVFSLSGNIGTALDSTNNQVTITGSGSAWDTRGFDLAVGVSGAANLLVISNGGAAFVDEGAAGLSASSSNNLVWVTGTGSVWSNGNLCEFGISGPANTLVVSNNGTVLAKPELILGSTATSLSNKLVVIGGNVFVTNAAHTAALDVRRGQLDFNGGTIIADSLLLTNNVAGSTNSFFNFSQGTLTTFSNSTLVWPSFFLFGTASNQTATWRMLGGSNTTELSGNDFDMGARLGSHGVVQVSGPSTVWTNNGAINVGGIAGSCQVIITNGAQVLADAVTLGSAGAGASNNLMVVNGSNSLFSTPGTIVVGQNAGGNQLVVTNGGAIAAAALTVGATSMATNNSLIVANGSLLGTNANGRLDSLTVGASAPGTLQFNGGTIAAEQFRVLNSSSVVNFIAGELKIGSATVNSAQSFSVGDGTKTGVLNLLDTGACGFLNGLVIRSNSFLIGSGAISGTLWLQKGGIMGPEREKAFDLNNPPLLEGETDMEIIKTASVKTNNQVRVNGTLTYGGTLNVFSSGDTLPSLGDRFPLFQATSYSGAFAGIILPPVGVGLMWTNKLLLDGSIQAVALAPPKFAGTALVGTNLVITGSGGSPGGSYTVLTSTNIASPLMNWVAIATSQFDWLGNFAFTNAVTPGVLQRFYLLQEP